MSQQFLRCVKQYNHEDKQVELLLKVLTISFCNFVSHCEYIFEVSLKSKNSIITHNGNLPSYLFI